MRTNTETDAKKRPRGRPTKFGPRVVAAITGAIADGVPFKFAAALGGISHETFCQWQRRFPDFSEAIQEAVARGVKARLGVIKAAARNGDVKAAQWWLEHVMPEHFARSRIEHQHSGPDGGTIVLDVRHAEEVLRRQFAREAGEPDAGCS